jgi:hypothetical protein
MTRTVRSFLSRIARASRLDSGVYEEVESDVSAMVQSVAVILLSGVATGIGSLLNADFVGVLNAVSLSVAGWLLCGIAAWTVGTRMLAEPQTQADFAEVLRVTGFASAPGLLRVFGIVPLVGGLVFVVTGLWMLVAMVIAIRQTLDYRSTWRALVVAGIAWIFFVTVSLLPLAF